MLHIFFKQFTKQREPSVSIKATWVVVEDMEFNRMAKLSYPMKGEVDERGKIDVGEDILSCGALDWYEKSFDRVTVKSEKPLLRSDKALLKNVTTTDDPVIRKVSPISQSRFLPQVQYHECQPRRNCVLNVNFFLSPLV